MSTDETSSRAFSLPVPIGGKVADKYRVDGVLGRGGMGLVVAATDLDLERRVAIKFVERKDEQAAARFLREARAAARLDSEHVTRVFEVGKLEHGAPFIVMERLEGEDLAQRIQAGPVPLQEAVGYAMQICEALAQAHAARIVHRDLKPGNLFVHRRNDGSSVVKVLDFGISKTLEGTVLTESQAIVGSPQYLAPEQIEHPSRVDHRTDIWSLGVVLYELISGQRPFRGSTMVELCMHILGSDPLPLSNRVDGVPQELERVLLRCLAKSMDVRFGSVAEVAQALAPFADAESARLLPVIQRARTRPAALEDSQGSAPGLEAGAQVADTVKHGVEQGTRSVRPPRRETWLLAFAAVAASLALFFALRPRPSAEHAAPLAAAATPAAAEASVEVPAGGAPADVAAPKAAAPAAAEAPAPGPPSAAAPSVEEHTTTPPAGATKSADATAARSQRPRRAAPAKAAKPAPPPNETPAETAPGAALPAAPAPEEKTTRTVVCRVLEVTENGRRIEPASGRVTFEWARRMCEERRPSRAGPYALSESGISVKCACE